MTTNDDSHVGPPRTGTNDRGRPRFRLEPELPSGWLEEIASDLQTQDNRCTAYPVFVVQQKRTVWGVEDGYEDYFQWIDDADCSPVPEPSPEAERCEIHWKAEGEAPEGYRRIGAKDYWEFVTACFTERGAEAYIKCNGHNLCSPRIYVESAYRNAEWQRVEVWLREGAPLTDQPSWTNRDQDELISAHEAVNMARSCLMQAMRSHPPGSAAVKQSEVLLSHFRSAYEILRARSRELLPDAPAPPSEPPAGPAPPDPEEESGERPTSPAVQLVADNARKDPTCDLAIVDVPTSAGARVLPCTLLKGHPGHCLESSG